MNHDAISVQLCLSAGLSETQTDVLLTRLTSRAGMPVDANAAIDAAFEAVRKHLCALSRYSFVARSGGVSRIYDRTGNWIEFDQAHALFDPAHVDTAQRDLETNR